MLEFSCRKSTEENALRFPLLGTCCASEECPFGGSFEKRFLVCLSHATLLTKRFVKLLFVLPIDKISIFQTVMADGDAHTNNGKAMADT